MKQVASKTADEAGDGTTTATVIAQAIIQHGYKAVAAGFSPMELKHCIDLGVSSVVEALAGMAVPCEQPVDIAEDGSGLQDILEVVEGIQFDRC